MNIRNSLLFGFAVPILVACGGSDTSSPPGSSVTVKITVENLPATLPINLPTSVDGLVEYSWSVIFDLDNNLARSAGDIRLAFGYIKPPGALPATVPVTDFDSGVFEFINETSFRRIPTAETTFQVTENTITIKVAKDQYEALSKINLSTKVQF